MSSYVFSGNNVSIKLYFLIAVSEEELKTFQTNGKLTVAGHVLDTDDVKVSSNFFYKNIQYI